MTMKKDKPHFTSVRFWRFKAFREYSVSLRQFNVMVGPNNSGKSTIIAAFRILSEGLRKARARKPEYLRLGEDRFYGYYIDLENLPVSTENVFTDYDDSEPATITFRLSNKNKLKLVFPVVNQCWIVPETTSTHIRTPTQFKKEFPVSIGFVPVLGPVDHNEQLFQKEAARLALFSHGASRNFRNIWWHYRDYFEDFRELVRSTWPGMDIERPEVDYGDKAILHMFCPEERFPREIYWAGFGFQVWCQMLTYMVSSRNDSLFIIDEPDIYLHSDLQRQLVSLLKELGPDILIATHSTEIISEAAPEDLLIINKKSKSAKRIKDPSELQNVFSVLGSNLNPTLTQLAKTRRAVFVEGKDFQIIALFARKLGYNEIANRSDFAVIPVEGFNPQRVREFSKAIEFTLGTSVLKGVVFDRDYRSFQEVGKTKTDLTKVCNFAHIHDRKEIENYLLEPRPLERAICRKITDRKERGQMEIAFLEDIEVILENLTEELRNQILGQYLANREPYEKLQHSDHDIATIKARLLGEFDQLWLTFKTRVDIIPGKQVLSLLNKYLQEKYSISLSIQAIISSFERNEIQNNIRNLIQTLDNFRTQQIE
jgi:energy-coupling factor transporter ATP-binding protein EcfA2